MQRRHRVRTAFAVFGVALLGLTACAPSTSVSVEDVTQVDGQLSGDLATELDAAVTQAIAATGSTGAIVEVRAPWSGSWTQAYGTVAPDGAATTVNSTFKIGQSTRLMTCDVLYGMAADGKLSLDDEVTTWLTGYPSAAGITLGQLCDSTSGIASYAGELSSRWWANPERVWNQRELVANGLTRARTTDPGAAYKASDTGYVLLGLVLERVGNADLTDLYDEYIFDPLDLENTSLPSSAGGNGWLHGLRSPKKDDVVDCSAYVDITDLSPSAQGASGGVVSTVDDLSDYIQSVALGTRSYDVAGRFQDGLAVSDNSPSWYTATGGGFQAGTLVGQSGSLPGYLTAAYADRETGLSVVVVLNNSRADGSLVRSLAWQLAAIASKAPAASGQTAPEAGLPWEASTYADAVADAAVCALP